MLAPPKGIQRQDPQVAIVATKGEDIAEQHLRPCMALGGGADREAAEGAQ
jgi:hypothetical protein